MFDPDQMAFPTGSNGHYGGLTKREYFATNAAPFELALRVFGGSPPNWHSDSERITFFSIWAMLNFEIADAMIEESQRKK